MQPTDSEIADRLRSILQSDEFQPRIAERIGVWLDEARRAVLNWLEHLSGPLKALVLLLALVVLAAVALQLWRSVRDAAAPRRASAGKQVARDEQPLSPEGLLVRARSMADAGNLRDAARALQQALLLQTCRERNLPWRSALSDWEWLRILRPAQSVIDFTRSTQRLAFGPEPSRAVFDACAERLDSLIRKPDDASSEAA